MQETWRRRAAQLVGKDAVRGLLAAALPGALSILVAVLAAGTGWSPLLVASVVLGAVLTASVAAAPVLFETPGKPPIRAANVPGYHPTRVSGLPRWLVAAGAGLAVLGLAFLAGVTSDAVVGPGRGEVAVVVAFVVIAVGTLAAATATASWFTARLVRRSQARGIRSHVEQLRPTLAILHSGGTGGSAYQLPMWLPYVERVGEPYIVVTQEPKTVPIIARLTDAPVICAGSADPRLLRQVLTDSIKVAFYVRNTKENRVFLAHRNITHVWLNHGDSDKPANFNPLHKEFDKLFVCGQLGVDRYAANGVEIPRERFEIIGRPQVAGIELADGPVAGTDEPVVLYAPTWMGLHSYDNYTSLPRGVEIVQRLVDRGVRVIFRPHPLSRKPAEIAQVEAVEAVLRADKEATGRNHVWGKKAETTWSVADCINRSDALISDVSSVVSDYLASLKPYALVAMNHTIEEFQEQFASARSAYVIDGQLENLDDQLDLLLGADPLRPSRVERREYTLGGFTGEEASDAFVATVRRLMGADGKPQVSAR